jgi:hypothetical protein
MNITKALEPTGKATRQGWKKNTYIAINDSSRTGIQQFFLYTILIGTDGERYGSIDVLDNDWQPYYEVKEIRPEKSGELWIHEKGGSFYVHSADYNEVPSGTTTTNHFGTIEKLPRSTVHSQDGWTRLYPPVEDENIERVVFENIKWHLSACWQTKPMPYIEEGGGGEYWGDIRDTVKDKPPMKMTLEFKKEG